jgi:hypothetical protein
MSRVGRARFVWAGERLHRQWGRGPRFSMRREAFCLDPERNPCLGGMELMGLIARAAGRLVGRMVVIRPRGGGPEGWFARLDLASGGSSFAALASEGGRWIALGGGQRWMGPVGLLPDDVSGIQVDGYIGRREHAVPRGVPSTVEALQEGGFEPVAETGFWRVSIPRHPRPSPTGCRVQTISGDPEQADPRLSSGCTEVWSRQRRSPIPFVDRILSDEGQRAALLRTAVSGGVTVAQLEEKGVAMGLVRPSCFSALGIGLPGWASRLRAWKRRAVAQEGMAQIWTVADLESDPQVGAAILDSLEAHARSRGFGRLLVGPISTDNHGVIRSLCDRGARIDCRFQIFAQVIDQRSPRSQNLKWSPRVALTRQQ